jgi:hypothetical protein
MVASKRLGVPESELAVADGVVSGGGKSVSYAQLIGGKRFDQQVEWNKQTGNAMDIKVQAKPKAPGAYKVVGKSFARRDVAWKVYGTGDYVTDLRRPGMLHARVIRPPRAACKVRGVDEASVKGIPGVRVFRERDFVAVLAPREWDAVRAAQALKVDWQAPDNAFPEMTKLHDHIRNAKAVKREEPVKVGDVAAAFKQPGLRIVEAEYEWPFQSHACMGPACALAEVKGDACTVWSGSQKPHYVRNGVAALLGMPEEKVRTIWVTGPGSYGRNDAGDAALEAAYLAKAMGKPVRVQGMRADATAWDPKGPASLHRARAALDASGRVVAYEFLAKGFSRQHIATNESKPADSLIGQALGMEAKPTWIFGAPVESYAFDNKLLAWETIAPLVDNYSPLRTGHLRDPVGPELHFASESFMDELAAAAGEDPVAFRLKYLTNPRHAAVVKAVAEKAGWKPRTSPSRDGKGRGLSFAERNGTAVAAVADVEVDRASGRVWARRFFIAHDCGLIINPMGLRQAIEGNVVQGTSRAPRGSALRPRFGEERRLGELPDPRDARRARVDRDRADRSSRGRAERRRRALHSRDPVGARQRGVRRNRRAHAQGAAQPGARQGRARRDIKKAAPRLSAGRRSKNSSWRLSTRRPGRAGRCPECSRPSTSSALRPARRSPSRPSLPARRTPCNRSPPRASPAPSP